MNPPSKEAIPQDFPGPTPVRLPACGSWADPFEFLFRASSLQMLAYFLTQDNPLASVSPKLRTRCSSSGTHTGQANPTPRRVPSRPICTGGLHRGVLQDPVLLSLYMQASVSEHVSQSWALERWPPHTYVLQASKVKPSRMLLREKITQGKRSEGGRKKLLGEGPGLPGADVGEAAGRPVTQAPIAAHN